MRYFVLILVSLVMAGVTAAQSDNRPRVFVEESNSWEVKGDSVYSTTDKKGRVRVSGGSQADGAKPRTAEIMKRFAEQCSAVVVTMNKEKADFVVLLEHEGGKDLFDKDNKLAVFNSDGDLIASGSFSRPKKAVEVACSAMASSAPAGSSDLN